MELTGSFFSPTHLFIIAFGSIFYIIFSLCISFIFLIIKSIEYALTKKSFQFLYYFKISFLSHLFTYVCAIYGSWIVVSQENLSDYSPLIPYLYVVIGILCINIYIAFLVTKKHPSVSKFEIITLGIISNLCIIFGSLVIPNALIELGKSF